jgi:transcription elongation GreA/GreB family factor
MTHLELKQNLVEECKRLQQKVIDNLRHEMNEAQQSANEYGPPKDRYDSYRMQMLRKKDMFGQQLDKAQNELYALEKIELKKEINVAEYGSVIITDDHKYFISIGLGKIVFNEEIYLAISGMVPIAKALAGKKKGDVAEFNGKKMKVIDVF